MEKHDAFDVLLQNKFDASKIKAFWVKVPGHLHIELVDAHKARITEAVLVAILKCGLDAVTRLTIAGVCQDAIKDKWQEIVALFHKKNEAQERFAFLRMIKAKLTTKEDLLAALTSLRFSTQFGTRFVMECSDKFKALDIADVDLHGIQQANNALYMALTTIFGIQPQNTSAQPTAKGARRKDTRTDARSNTRTQTGKERGTQDTYSHVDVRSSNKKQYKSEPYKENEGLNVWMQTLREKPENRLNYALKNVKTINRSEYEYVLTYILKALRQNERLAFLEACQFAVKSHIMTNKTDRPGLYSILGLLSEDDFFKFVQHYYAELNKLTENKGDAYKFFHMLEKLDMSQRFTIAQKCPKATFNWLNQLAIGYRGFADFIKLFSDNDKVKLIKWYLEQPDSNAHRLDWLLMFIKDEHAKLEIVLMRPDLVATAGLNRKPITQFNRVLSALDKSQHDTFKEVFLSDYLKRREMRNKDLTKDPIAKQCLSVVKHSEYVLAVLSALTPDKAAQLYETFKGKLFWYRHKGKILGGIAMVLGAALAVFSGLSAFTSLVSAMLIPGVVMTATLGIVGLSVGGGLFLAGLVGAIVRDVLARRRLHAAINVVPEVPADPGAVLSAEDEELLKTQLRSYSFLGNPEKEDMCLVHILKQLPEKWRLHALKYYPKAVEAHWSPNRKTNENNAFSILQQLPQEDRFRFVTRHLDALNQIDSGEQRPWRFTAVLEKHVQESDRITVAEKCPDAVCRVLDYEGHDFSKQVEFINLIPEADRAKLFELYLEHSKKPLVTVGWLIGFLDKTPVRLEFVLKHLEVVVKQIVPQMQGRTRSHVSQTRLHEQKNMKSTFNRLVSVTNLYEKQCNAFMVKFLPLYLKAMAQNKRSIEERRYNETASRLNTIVEKCLGAIKTEHDFISALQNFKSSYAPQLIDRFKGKVFWYRHRGKILGGIAMLLGAGLAVFSGLAAFTTLIASTLISGIVITATVGIVGLSIGGAMFLAGLIGAIARDVYASRKLNTLINFDPAVQQPVGAAANPMSGLGGAVNGKGNRGAARHNQGPLPSSSYAGGGSNLTSQNGNGASRKSDAQKQVMAKV